MVAKREIGELLSSGNRPGGRELLSALRAAGYDVRRTAKATHYMVCVGERSRVLLAIGAVSPAYLSRLRQALREEGELDG
ncbi:MAG: hypothetical protein ACYC6C_04215 [Coriobacteriia bacterium]